MDPLCEIQIVLHAIGWMKSTIMFEILQTEQVFIPNKWLPFGMFKEGYFSNAPWSWLACLLTSEYRKKNTHPAMCTY